MGNERPGFDRALSRRSFLAIAAAAGAGTLLSEGVCAASAQEQEEGEWIAAACWDNCGGRCVNRVLVRNGEIVRQGSENSHEDSFGWLQQRGCPRGRARQQMVLGEERIKYPMKRVHWQPGGGENACGELRGGDEWERISWDEAIDLIASEVRRIYGDYGPQAVVGTKATAVGKVLCSMGGYVSLSDTSSAGTYAFNVQAMGLPSQDLGLLNDRYDNKNAETIVLMGGNGAWSSGGSTMCNFDEAKEAGVSFVYVGPSYNATAAYFDARWIPVLPGTDTAFMLGVCYEMLRQGVVDREFLDTHCVGFDLDHMPDDATLAESFEGYLNGDYDGMPKTAEWASAICGTPVEDIVWFAETVGKDHKVMLMHNYALARCSAADNVPQLFMAMGAMGGHFGKSGHACGGAYKTYAGAGGPTLVAPGSNGLPGVPNPCPETLPEPLLWRCIAEGRFNSTGAAYGTDFRPETIIESELKFLNIEGRNTIQTAVGMTEMMESIKKLDFVLDTAYSYDASAQYADIVLPLCTEWERVGGFPGHQRSRETLIVYTQVIDPVGEARTEFQIGRALAAALGIDPDGIWPISEEQAFFNQIAGATLLDVDGEKKPLITITAEDISARGVVGEPQEGFVGLDEFLKAGCYTVKRSEGDAYSFIGYEGFVADPEANPLGSPSGKFEIYNQYKADTINAMGYSPDGTFKPYPNYIEQPEGREGMFRDRIIGGEPSDHPFIAYNVHYLRRAHGVFDSAPWLREAWPNPVYLNASDAAAKGISTGDMVRVYNDNGSILRRASCLETVMPGCVGIPHGAWLDWDDEAQLDRAGADNVLCGCLAVGQATSGYNNYNCNYELYAGDEMPADCDLPARTVPAQA